MAATKAAKAKIVKTPLEELASGYHQRTLQILLWKNRINNPSLTVQVSKKDIAGLDECLTYLKKSAQVRVFVRGEQAIISMVDEASKVIVRREGKDGKKVDETTLTTDEGVPVLKAGDEVVSIGDAIVPVENNEEDFDKAQKANELRRIREGAISLANTIKTDAGMGTFSASLIIEAAESLVALARAA